MLCVQLNEHTLLMLYLCHNAVVKFFDSQSGKLVNFLPRAGVFFCFLLQLPSIESQIQNKVGAILDILNKHW